MSDMAVEVGRGRWAMVLGGAVWAAVWSPPVSAQLFDSAKKVPPACDPIANGAIGDGQSDNTKALQATIDGCKGAWISLPPGTYMIRPLFFRSGVTLDLASGTTIIGTDDPEAYKDGKGGLLALFNGNNVTGVTIRGAGRIDGQGKGWWADLAAAEALRPADQERPDEAPGRPRLMRFQHSSGITIQRVTLQNSPSYHLVFRHCDDVQVTGVSILAPDGAPNTDGIDVISSRSVRITTSYIAVGEDDIAIKAEGDPADPDNRTSGVRIRGSSFNGGNGVAIGSVTTGGIDDVLVEANVFTETRWGIRIKTARDRGGSISNLVFRDLRMDTVGLPIMFVSYFPTVPDKDQPVPLAPTTPRIEGIRVQNLRATDANAAGAIFGLPESPIKNLLLQDVSIDAQSGLYVRWAGVKLVTSTITALKGDPIVRGEGAEVQTVTKDASAALQ